MSTSENYYEIKPERYEDYHLRLKIFKQNLRDVNKDMERV